MTIFDTATHFRFFWRQHLLQTIIALCNIFLFIYLLIFFIFTGGISVSRLFASIAFPFALMIYAFRRKSVSPSGAIIGLLIAFLALLCDVTIFIAILACYFATSRATPFGESIKRDFEANFKAGGNRDWTQVISNLGVAAICIIAKRIILANYSNRNCSEMEIDFERNFAPSWLLLASLGAIACSLGDTLSSELGPVFAGAREDALLITNFRTVPRGTNGAITIAGVVAAAAGGAIIGFAACISQTIFATTCENSSEFMILQHHQQQQIEISPQWPILLFCIYAGLFGSLLDSFLGATCQYTGYDHLRKRIVETDSSATIAKTYVEHISGRDLLDNHDVNLLANLAMAIITPTLASYVWPTGATW